MVFEKFMNLNLQEDKTSGIFEPCIYVCVSADYLACLLSCAKAGTQYFPFIVNLIFYGWGEPRLVLLMVFNIFFNYIGGWLVDKYRADAKKKKLFLILTCVLDIGILAVFKYTGMITETLNMLPFLNIPELQISLPIGISFYTFQTMSYVIDVYRDDAPVSKNFINFGTYVALFRSLLQVRLSVTVMLPNSL